MPFKELFSRIDRRSAAAIIVPVLVAAIVFGISVSMYPGLPILGDPVIYHMTAQRLLEQGTYAHGPGDPSSRIEPNAGVTPGYAIFLSGVYAVTGSRSTDATASVIAVQPKLATAQFLLMLGVVGLIAGSGLLLGGRPLAMSAGMLAAMYAPFAWTSSVALGESLATFLMALMLLTVLLAVREDTPHRHRLLFMYGIVAAAFVLVRPAMVLWLPFPVLFLAVRRTLPWREWLRAVAVVAVGCMLLLGPWWVRNLVSLHRFIPLADNSGRVRYFATGGGELTAAEQKTYDAAQARDRDGWNAVASQRMGTALRRDPAGFLRSRYDMAMDSTAFPWSAVGDVYWAMQNTPGIVSIPRGEFALVPSSTLSKWSRISIQYHRLLLLLAAVAIGLIPRSPRLALVSTVPLYTIALHSATMFLPRYFLPAMPAVILMAAAAAYWAAHQVRRRASGTR